MLSNPNAEQGEYIKCPECGKIYSSDLMECPACGWTEDCQLTQEIQTNKEKISNELRDRLESLIGTITNTYVVNRKRKDKDSALRNLRLARQYVETAADKQNAYLWEYIGKEFELSNGTVSFTITFYPSDGYANLDSCVPYRTIEELYAKKHGIYPESSGLGDNEISYYDFMLPYIDAVGIIKDLKQEGYRIRQTKEVNWEALSQGFEIWGNYLRKCFLDKPEVVLPNYLKKMNFIAFWGRSRI